LQRLKQISAAAIAGQGLMANGAGHGAELCHGEAFRRWLRCHGRGGWLGLSCLRWLPSGKR
jgi:hypothetical protein